MEAQALPGGITISNLGGIGGSYFTPIINKPEEALKALDQGRVDFLVTEKGLYAKA